MSDSEFVSALRKERQGLVPLTEAPELPAAREAKRIANDEYQAHLESRRASGIISGPATQQEHDMNQAATAANHAVDALEQSQERAQNRIKEIDRLLTAGADADRARKDLAKTNASVADARARIGQLAQIAADLERDIADVTQRRISAVEAQGREDLAQRLAGKTAPPAKGISAIDTDLESRRTTLAAAQAAKAEAEGPLPTLLEAVEQARSRLRHALQRAAELEYYELLPAMIPIAARLVILQSRLCSYSAIEIHVDDEARQAANAALEKELNA